MEPIVKEIEARTLLSSVKQPDLLFGLRYNMNLYRGCQHQCIYCDSRSECYQIEDFRQIQIKTNALEVLDRELAGKRTKGTIGTGSMHDPYMPIEARLNFTGRALEIIARHGFPVHVITKSDLVLKDLDTLRQISRVYTAVSFTITTADDDLCRKIEPGAPPASKRFQAMEKLAAAGILTGVTMMPVLPFIEDNEQSIAAIVEKAGASGAKYILAWFGMSLRDRQRAYYYASLDRLFPGLRRKYELRYGNQYQCACPNTPHLEKVFSELCKQHGLETRIIPYQPESQTQLELF